MSYKISFKGGMEDITLSDEKGAKLMGALREGVKGMFEVEGAMFDMNSIRAILPSKEDFSKKRATPEEIALLGQELMKFPQKEIDGALVSPFDQYLIFKGIRGQYENGQLYCIDAEEDSRLGRINADLEYRQYAKWRKAITDDELALHWKRVKEKFPLRPASPQRTNQTKSIGDILKGRL